MFSLTQAQIAKKYGISRATVNRWIQLTQEGKYNLQLDSSNGIVRVIDNQHNHLQIKLLAEEGKKFKSSNERKIVDLPKEFYDIFTQEEIIEIANDLEFKKQINIKFFYKNGGAGHWNAYYLSQTSQFNTSNIDLIKNSISDILYYLPTGKKINLIDVGPGNGYPVKDFITDLINTQDYLERYISLDISPEINEITLKNMSNWFPSLKTKMYVQDIETSRFNKIFLENKSQKKGLSNVIMYIGSTLNNIDDRIQVLKNLRNGMTNDDLLIFTFSHDTLQNRSMLNYVSSKESNMHANWFLELIGLDYDNCEVIYRYDEKNNVKTKVSRLDKDYIIRFKLFGETREVELLRGEEINRWKHYLITKPQLLDELQKSELELVSLKLDTTNSIGLAICKASF